MKFDQDSHREYFRENDFEDVDDEGIDLEGIEEENVPTQEELWKKYKETGREEDLPF